MKASKNMDLDCLSRGKGCLAIVALAVAGIGAWYISPDTRVGTSALGMAAEAARLERLKFVVSVLGTVGAAIVFLMGLCQYRIAERWKRAEFAIKEFKSALEKPRVAMALRMIDWAGRDLKLAALDDPTNETPTLVTLEMQCRALMPHTIVDSAGMRVTSPDEEVVALNNRESGVSNDGLMRAFTREETIIRDCYDSLFDCWSYINYFLESGLIRVPELQPYLRYWIDAIAERTSDPRYALWNVCLFSYVRVYQFDGVTGLFDHYGYDIRPDGELFKSFMAVVDDSQQELARSLQVEAKRY
jgi:hypothetical protein